VERPVEKQYNPSEVEQKIYDNWIAKDYFSADPHSDKEPYSIVIPPPNVTGVLHMGHALNNTIQDVLTRYKRMDGYEALWMPGTDHAGIATQNVVERKLHEEGTNRHKLGRVKFLEEVWKWKDEYHATISNQLRKLGSSCDWDRERFTMDEGLSKAVRKTFVQLYEQDLVYRGKYIVNWCPRCHTALADDEVDHHDQEGKLWYMKYPLTDGSGFLTVATTRPETMLGDTAVAVNPKDERFLHMVGKTITLPIVGREVPIITDDYVSRKLGTGAVKITPAHDPNDYLMGQRHDLEPIVIMDEAAKMCGDIPERYKGVDRFDARKMIIDEFEAAGLLEKIEKHDNAVGHCYRCHTVVEPYYSDQWFVKMKPLAERALQAVVDDEITFHPPRWKKTYIDWMENIRDWCISRQIWWGHRIPVWYCEDCGEINVSETDVTECQKCKSTNLRQDEDVMDTWFSSWLWPFTTMGWPEDTAMLNKFFPTDTLVTAPEILFFWVARMVMSSLHFTDKLPFKNVILHGTVRDKTGRKMSKSLGNSINPLDTIEKSGTDALRFSIIMITAQGADVFLGEDTFDIGRNFANKLWNASRFLMANIEEPITIDQLPAKEDLKLEDKWILTRLQITTESLRKALDEFKLNEGCRILYDFIWHDICDWYIESKKGDFYKPATPKDRENALKVAVHTLAEALKLLHPIMPFVTEEIWGHLRGKVTYPAVLAEESIMIDTFPKSDSALIDEDAAAKFSTVQDMIVSLRTIRSENGVPPEKKGTAVISTADAETAEWLAPVEYLVNSFVKLTQTTIAKDAQKPGFSGDGVVQGHSLYLELEGLIDREVEVARLSKEIAHLEKISGGINGKLNNKNFTDRAPDEVVAKEREKLESILDNLGKLKVSLEQLKG
jgi:valyl-tRNA synthetase